MTDNRLFQMLFLLLEKGNATAPELAEHFEVSVRTIYRDIDILSSAGIPVYTAQGKGGGIFIRENFVLNKSMLSEQEQKQILLSLQGLSILDDENTGALLSKLGAIFQKQNVNWIEMDFSEWSKKNEDVFHGLQSAIFKNRIIEFTYYSGKGQRESRHAEPLKLVFKSRDWYLYAFCHTRQDFRLFKLNRIKNLRVTEQGFVRAAPDRVFDHVSRYTEETVALSLVLQKELVYRAYDEFDDVTELDDGSYSANITLPDNEGLYRFLLSFGDSIEVMAPPQVRETMRMKINAMKSKYIG